MFLSNNAIALGLYSYNKNALTEKDFSLFYSIVIKLFNQIGIAPTFIGVDAKGHSGKLIKISGKESKKLVSSGFKHINLLTIGSNPPESNEFSYDYFAYASISYVEGNKEAFLCFMVNESFLRLFTEEFDWLVDELVKIHDWDFGYAFSDRTDRKPEYYIMGIDGGFLNKEEENELNTWYLSESNDKIRRLRDIYPYNILNTNQLNQLSLDGQSLQFFLEQLPGSTCLPLKSEKLNLCKIKDGKTLAQLREILEKSGLLIRN